MADSLDIVMPVYNEGPQLASTLRHIAAVTATMAPSRFVVADDPGSDDTDTVLQQLAAELSMVRARGDRRRGYSVAMLDGWRATTAPYVLCIDSDGQYDPRDIARLWQARGMADMISGRRVARAEAPFRRVGSVLFGIAVRTFFPLPAQDPSSSLVLLRRSALEQLLPMLGAMPEAFWWEVSVRAQQAGLRTLEVPVQHHARAAGETQVYRMMRLPGVIIRQLRGLIMMRTSSPGGRARRLRK